MEIQGKVWGLTSPLFAKNNVEIHRIEVKKNGFCSLHHHDHKSNMFFVESGMLKVEVEKSYGLVDETVLFAGCHMTVPPGEKHRFVALMDCVVFEIYWVCLDPNDIVRQDVGGTRL